MKKEFKIGDRYQWNCKPVHEHELFWGIIEFIEDDLVIVLSGKQKDQTKSSHIVRDYFENYTYLGNFSKNGNFNNLYNKLCASI